MAPDDLATTETIAPGVLPKTSPFAPTRPGDVFASLPYQGVPKTLAQMDAGIAAEAKRRHGRKRT